MHFNLVHALVDMSSKGLLLGCCSIGVGAGRPKFVVVWWRGGVPAQSRRGAGQLQVYDSSCFVIVAWWYERATSSRREGQPGLAARPHDGDRDEREKRRDREIAICIKRARSLLLNDAHPVWWLQLGKPDDCKAEMKNSQSGVEQCCQYSHAFSNYTSS